jgi:hypothetical protein
VEIIEEEAFRRCYDLNRINLSSVRIIGRSAFRCTSLADIEFGDRLETIGEYAFCCLDLRNVKLPNVRNIEEGAFHGCEHLTEVELSKDLLRIETEAFSDCPQLRHIAMPLKDNLLGNQVFNEWNELSQVDLVGGIHKTVSSLLLERWRNDMNTLISQINWVLSNFDLEDKTATIRGWMERVLETIEHFKLEHYKLLKEAMSLLELALWKANLDDNMDDDAAAQEGVRVTRGQRKRARKNRRITSGASIVIKNVLPFLELE